MVQNTTDGIDATSSWAWIDTVQILACFVRGTVRIDHTFRSTCNIWVPKIVRDTSAWSCAISLLTVCIRAARWRVAWVDYLNRDGRCKEKYHIPEIKITWHTCCNSRAESEGIACVAWVTSADRVVILGSASCVASTHPWTGVHTLLVHTCFVCWALWVDGALWLAFYVWVSKQSRQAGTWGCTISFPALGIYTAWRWATRVNYFRSWTCGYKFFIKKYISPWQYLTCWSDTSGERISYVTLVAHTYRYMVPHSAVGVLAAQTWTRVLAFTVDTSKCWWTVRVNNTLWSAVRRWPNHFGKAWALAAITYLPGWQSIVTTWVWITRIVRNNGLNSC